MAFFRFSGGGQAEKPPDSSQAFIATVNGEPYVKDVEALWKEVQDLKEEGLAERKRHERMWALCWLFYKGDQWYRTGLETTLIRVNVGKKPRVTINRVLPMVQTRRAHVLKNRPAGIVMPRTTDEEDRNAARIAQDVLNYDQEHLKNWALLDGKLSLAMFVTGNAFKKIYWDPTKGRIKERNVYQNSLATGAPLPAPNDDAASGEIDGAVPKSALDQIPGDQRDEEKNATTYEPEGDISLEFVPPEEIIPEAAARSLDECQRLIHATLKPLRWVKEAYGPAADEVKAIDTKSSRGRSVVEAAKLFGLSESEVSNRVEVLEVWYRPTEKFPDGLHAVWADDRLMAAGPTPPGHYHIPFIHYIEIETDEFWGSSSVAQIIDPQRALNLAISRDEYMRQRLRPKLFVPTDAGLDEAAYTNDDTELVYVHHPFYPKFSEPPEFKRDAEAVAYYRQAIDDIGGSPDILRGQIAGGDIRSGRMVNYLQEYAGTVLAGPARVIERGEELTGNMILRLRKHYTTEPRLYYIVGREKSVEVKQFIGSDIEGCADYVVQAGSALPMSASEKRDLVLSLVEKGIMLPGDPRVLKLLGMPSDLEELFDEKQIDRDNATEENHAFLALSEDTVMTAINAVEQAQQAQISAIMPLVEASQTPRPQPEQPQPEMMPGTPPSASPGQEQQQQPAAQSAPPMNPMQELAQIKPTPTDVLELMRLQPRDFEDHQVHLEQHNKARKSKAYKKLPPAVAALFDEHCDLHAMYLLPPPMAAPPGAGPEGRGTGEPGPEEQGGSPKALSGKEPPGTGGAGAQNAQGNQERRAGLPPTPSPPGANNHHLR